MTGSVIRVDDRDLAQLAGRGRDLSTLDDTAPLMRDLSAAMLAWTDRRFETETAPDGSPWQPSRRALEQGGQTLTNTARLRQSNSARSDRTSAEVGNNLVYGGIHQTGGTIRPVSAGALKFRIGDRFVTTDEVEIPARPYLGLGPEDEAEVGHIVRDFLSAPIDGARP